jgi:hypothetical protein
MPMLGAHASVRIGEIGTYRGHHYAILYGHTIYGQGFEKIFVVHETPRFRWGAGKSGSPN